jgi:hypothetical protein
MGNLFVGHTLTGRERIHKEWNRESRNSRAGLCLGVCFLRPQYLRVNA